MNRVLFSVVLISLLAVSVISQRAWGVDCSSFNITLPTQEAVDNFQITYGGGGTCDTVRGYLIVGDNTVGGTDITNLSGLANLFNLGGALMVDNNPTLTNIDGLVNLNTVGGSLNISRNPSLADIDGLVNLVSVGDFLQISGANSLTDIDALINLTSVGGDLYIGNNLVLTDINGLANLSYLGGGLQIQGNLALVNLNGLASITNVKGQLGIVSNTALTNVDGLANLTSVGLNFYLWSAVMTNIDGLTNLTSVGGTFDIRANPNLTNLDGLASLSNVEGALNIAVNTVLSNIDGLANLNGVGAGLEISSNQTLGDCTALAALLGWPSGPPNDEVGLDINIGSNSTGCSSLQEILDSVFGPTAPNIASADAFNGQAILAFSSATTTDALWPIIGYYAQCLSDEQFIFENNTMVDIPDESSVVSSLTISGVPFRNAAGLNVAVDITHPRTRHLTLTLASPSGTSVMLWDEVAGDGENLLGTFPTTLEPAESLGAVDGEDFSGEWRLTVADGVPSQIGTLNSWGITVRDKVTATSESSPITLAGLADSQTYSCTVSAITGLGIGPASNTASVTPTPDLIFSNGFEDN